MPRINPYLPDPRGSSALLAGPGRADQTVTLGLLSPGLLPLIGLSQEELAAGRVRGNIADAARLGNILGTYSCEDAWPSGGRMVQRTDAGGLPLPDIPTPNLDQLTALDAARIVAVRNTPDILGYGRLPPLASDAEALGVLVSLALTGHVPACRMLSSIHDGRIVILSPLDPPDPWGDADWLLANYPRQRVGRGDMPVIREPDRLLDPGRLPR